MFFHCRLRHNFQVSSSKKAPSSLVIPLGGWFSMLPSYPWKWPICVWICKWNYNIGVYICTRIVDRWPSIYSFLKRYVYMRFRISTLRMHESMRGKFGGPNENQNASQQICESLCRVLEFIICRCMGYLVYIQIFLFIHKKIFGCTGYSIILLWSWDKFP